jgi:hypothetical protein
MSALRLLPATLLIVCGACVSRQTNTVEVMADPMEASSDLRSATNLPPRFVVVTAPATPGDCPPQLSDPGLRTTLRLQRSILRQMPDSTTVGYGALGDYSVEPAGLYGELAGEGLRVDCTRLRAVGVVRL